MKIDEGKPNEVGAMGTHVWICQADVVQYIGQHCQRGVAMKVQG